MKFKVYNFIECLSLPMLKIINNICGVSAE